MSGMSMFGIGSTIAGGILGAYSSLKGADAKAKEMQYKAGIARINKQVALQNADWTRRAGEVGAQHKGMEGRFKIGQTRAIQSGRGLEIDTGSNAAVQESEREVNQYDQSMIRSNAAHRAYGFEVEAVEKEAEAGMLEMGAKNVKEAGEIGAWASILGASSSVADKWMQYSTTFGSTKNPVDVGSATGFGY